MWYSLRELELRRRGTIVVVDMTVRFNGEEHFERLGDMGYIRDIMKLVEGKEGCLGYKSSYENDEYEI